MARCFSSQLNKLCFPSPPFKYNNPLLFPLPYSIIFSICFPQFFFHSKVCNCTIYLGRFHTLMAEYRLHCGYTDTPI